MAGEHSKVAGMNVFQFHSVIHVNPCKFLKNPRKSKESQYKFTKIHENPRNLTTKIAENLRRYMYMSQLTQLLP